MLEWVFGSNTAEVDLGGWGREGGGGCFIAMDSGGEVRGFHQKVDEVGHQIGYHLFSFNSMYIHSARYLDRTRVLEVLCQNLDRDSCVRMVLSKCQCWIRNYYNA